MGGHPRTLDYLDALLRGGTARFPDVARRMEKALKKRGIEDPAAWVKEHSADLDASLATAVTLAVDDVVLADLVAWADQVPLAKALLLGACVYRIPVDEVGLAWQVGEEVRSTDPPDLGYSLEQIARLQAGIAARRRHARKNSCGIFPIYKYEGGFVSTRR